MDDYNFENTIKNFPPVRFEAGHYNIEQEKFIRGLNLIKESLGEHAKTVYSSDNMICWNRNYGFLRDPFY